MNSRTSIIKLLSKISLIAGIIGISIVPISIFIDIIVGLITLSFSVRCVILIPLSVIALEMKVGIYISILTIILGFGVKLARNKVPSKVNYKASIILGLINLISTGFIYFVIDTWNAFWKGLFNMNM